VLLPEVQEAQTDLARFGKLVKLVAFFPFKTAANALDNINCISEGNGSIDNMVWKVLYVLVTC
jgi:nucleolar protein 56